LMAVVPLSNVWIDANFKEVQLARMRVGQPVTVKADIYGGSVTYHGTVEGLGVAVSVDVRDQSGPVVTESVGPGTTRANTGEDSGPAADAMIARILSENGAQSSIKS